MHDFRTVFQRFKKSLLTEYIPHLHSHVPTGARKNRASVRHSIRRRETYSRDRRLMWAEDVKELASLQWPNVNFERIKSSSCDNITTWALDGQTAELGWFRGAQRSKVPVLDEIVGSNRTVETCREDSIALLWNKLKCGNLARMLRKRYKAQTILSGPHFELSIITPCCQVGTIRWVRNSIEVEMMSLLLHDVGFGFPLPHKELALLFGAERDPLTIGVDRDGVDSVLCDLEWMYWLQIIEIVHAEYSVGLTYN